MFFCSNVFWSIKTLVLTLIQVWLTSVQLPEWVHYKRTWAVWLVLTSLRHTGKTSRVSWRTLVGVTHGLENHWLRNCWRVEKGHFLSSLYAGQYSTVFAQRRQLWSTRERNDINKNTVKKHIAKHSKFLREAQNGIQHYRIFVQNGNSDV